MPSPADRDLRVLTPAAVGLASRIAAAQTPTQRCLSMASDLATQRERLLERIRASTEIGDARILQAFDKVPRHEFLSEAQRDVAYDDRALPLDEGQTVSQPSMIAIMLQELRCEPGQRALEIGAGSGYAAAVLAQLVAEVYAVELRPTLAARARAALERSQIHNVRIIEGDGTLGLPEHAPYDRILVSAAPTRVPDALIAQLAVGGRLAIPVGDERSQTLVIAHKVGRDSVDWQRTVPCIFVPLVSR